MNPNLKLILLTSAALLFLANNARLAHAQGNKLADCPVLTSAMIETVLNQHFQSSEKTEAPSMYGGASGWSCTYRGGGIRIDFTVYTEASSAEAKRTFEKYAVVAADDSKGKPSIGDSAYWVTQNDKKEPYIFVLKGKVHFSIGIRPANETQLKNLASTAASGI